MAAMPTATTAEYNARFVLMTNLPGGSCIHVPLVLSLLKDERESKSRMMKVSDRTRGTRCIHASGIRTNEAGVSPTQ
jgi:hypothetical protein